MHDMRRTGHTADLYDDLASLGPSSYGARMCGGTSVLHMSYCLPELPASPQRPRQSMPRMQGTAQSRPDKPQCRGDSQPILFRSKFKG